MFSRENPSADQGVVEVQRPLCRFLRERAKLDRLGFR